VYILNQIIPLSGREIRVEVEKERLRPIDVPLIVADVTKIKERTGWEQKISLEQTLRDTLAYWRENLAE